MSKLGMGLLVVVIAGACGWGRMAVAAEPAASPVPREGLVLWLTGEDAVVENGEVVQIADRSGNRNDAQRQKEAKIASGNPKVVKHEESGRPVLRFNGAFVGYEFKSIPNLRTVFWVVSKDPAAFKKFAERFVMGGAKSREFHVGAHWTDTIIELGFQKHIKAYFNGFACDPSLSEFAPKLAVISMVLGRDADADQLFRDRAFTDRSWQGDVAEIILYTAPLSDADRQAVEKHLMAKYSIKPFEPVVVPRESVLPGHTKPPGGDVKPGTRSSGPAKAGEGAKH